MVRTKKTSLKKQKQPQFRRKSNQNKVKVRARIAVLYAAKPSSAVRLVIQLTKTSK